MSNPTVNNYYASLDDDEDDDRTVVASNCTSNKTINSASETDDSTISSYESESPIILQSKHATRAQAWNHLLHKNCPPSSPHAETIYNTSNIKIGVDMAIADAGATSHFLIAGAPVINQKVAAAPIRINLPDGAQLTSSHTATLDIPWIPRSARQAHIVPGLSHTSLISIKALCDAGCTVTYTREHCDVEYKKKLVWQGVREPCTGLWVLPLRPKEPTEMMNVAIQATATEEAAYNVHALTSKASLMKFLHQCLLSPPKTTLLKAIDNNQLPTWPGLTTNAVKRYLPETSPATDKGHMKRQRKGLRSTKEKVATALNSIEYERDMHPPLEKEEFNQLFCYSGQLDPKTGTVYTDFTGRFPLRSVDGMTSIFILYDWTTNAILPSSKPSKLTLTTSPNEASSPVSTSLTMSQAKQFKRT